jgi:hypothetical protein
LHAMTAMKSISHNLGTVVRFSFTSQMEEETKTKCAGWMWTMDLLLSQPCESWA